MSKNLVIMESPAKAKTVEKFLGKDYKVLSSQGHIRDLKRHDLSVDLANGFEPEYEVSAEKKKIVAELQKAAREADTVWLASDEDREGEAIAWHLAEVLGLDLKTTKRIVFHEITKDAILHALQHPRTIDLNLVDAQQARRVLDRIVGFELSPVLWRKVKPGLSAGRVQSVTVRLVCEREAEIRAFKPEAFWRVTARFAAPDGQEVKAEIARRFKTRAEVEQLLRGLEGAEFSVTDIKATTVKKSPMPPFTTSTLQQEAGRKLGMAVQTTMRVAQSLYEAGHITYMRTDSLNLSSQAVGAIAAEVKAKLGEEYLHTRSYHTHSKGAQEAHEAIRPTYLNKPAPAGLTDQEQRLYSLIYKRTVASQMADALIEKTTVEVTPKGQPEATFRLEGQTIKFEGWMKVYLAGGTLDEESSDANVYLPPLTVGAQMRPLQVEATERFTQQPARYTESTLVRKMEELGIGRPATYAPTISTIQQRNYVARGEKPGTPREYEVITLTPGKPLSTETRTENYGAERGRLIPTDIGLIVNDYLTDRFPDILDYEFTAQMEDKLDSVAEGRLKWNDEIGQFYGSFHPAVESAAADTEGRKPGERLLGQDPRTGKPVAVKIGRYGAMVQIGTADDDEKPRFASLRPDQSVFDITLDEALRLFDLPRLLGLDEEGHEVKAAVGRFGPYVSANGVFASIPKESSPTAVTLEEALELLAEKREAEARKVIKTFDDDPDLRVLNGRWGPYIAVGKKNYKIPKTVTDASALTLDECRHIIANQPAPKSRAPRRSTKK